MAIEHQIPIVPMVFLDCKRKFPWHTNYGVPGKLRVETFEAVAPKKNIKDMEDLQEEIRDIILKGILEDPLQKNQEAINLETSKQYLFR